MAILSLLSMPLPALAAAHSRAVCGHAIAAGHVRCLADVVSDPTSLLPLATSQPQGYGPADFAAAYGDHGNSTTTIGIVTAFDAPHLAADVTTYSRQYGLPLLPVCQTSSQASCLFKSAAVGTNLPTASSSWAIETSLDTEAAHGMCPNCRLDIVEASSSSMSDLAAAASAAARAASIVSNSYGGPESATETRYDANYQHSGSLSVVSSGDNGYGVSYPASSINVLAVGGTTLTMRNGRLVSETAWDGAGSGCSRYEPKPAWQTDRLCSRRAVADVAADADPATGAAIYDSYPNQSHSGWYTVGGTSLAAPLVAGLIARSGSSTGYPAILYGVPRPTRDIVSGNNGSCSISYLCRSGVGYDGPTGMGALRL